MDISFIKCEESSIEHGQLNGDIQFDQEQFGFVQDSCDENGHSLRTAPETDDFEVNIKQEIEYLSEEELEGEFENSLTDFREEKHYAVKDGGAPIHESQSNLLAPHERNPQQNECHICKRKFTMQKYLTAHLASFERNKNKKHINNSLEATSLSSSKENDSNATVKVEALEDEFMDAVNYSYEQTEEPEFKVIVDTLTEELLPTQCVDVQNENLLHLDRPNIKNTELRKEEIFLVQETNQEKLFKQPVTVDPSTFQRVDNSEEICKDVSVEMNHKEIGIPSNRRQIVAATDNMLTDSEGKTIPLYKCQFCSKWYENRQSLRTHLRIHTKSYQCDYCDASFRDAYMLRHHHDRHQGVKSHECTLCGKGFTTLNELKLHGKRVHSLGDSKHKCTICEKSFPTLGDLNKHFKRHLNIRPHACQLCGSTFQTVGELNRHLKRHQETKSHSCSYCQRTFKCESDMKTHIKRMHLRTGQHKYHPSDSSFVSPKGLNSQATEAHAATNPL